MSEWWAHLEGSDTDLAYLSTVLTSPAFAVQRKNGHFYLRSTDLDPLENPRLVKEVASAILRSLNGLIRLRIHTSRPLTVGNLERVDDAGRTNHIILTDSGTLALSRVSALGWSNSTQDPLPALLALSRTDEPLTRALRLYEVAVQPWKDLYPIYEIIESDMEGEAALVSRGWSSRKQISRFTRTAGHPKVAGDEARHGVSTVEPPPNPMTEAEAWVFIKSLLNQWLEFKQSRP